MLYRLILFDTFPNRRGFSCEPICHEQVAATHKSSDVYLRSMPSTKLKQGRQSPFDPVRNRRLADQVMSQIRERINRGEFAVGDRMPSEPELMQQLGVGRTTVREAIRVLAHMGHLEVRQGSGTFVTSLTGNVGLAERLCQAHVREVYQVRRALEVEIVRLAAVKSDAKDLETIRMLIEQLKANLKAGTREAFLDTDLALYAALAASTKNSVLIDLYASFAQALRVALTQVMGFPGVMKACVSRHERVFQSLSAGDAQTAEAVTAQFLERVSHLIDELLGDSLIENGPNGDSAATEKASLRLPTRTRGGA
jgi:GntR family transcriptional repressor for pyruvate dehydrogenase complex